MPGATVTLTNTGTGLVRVVVTDANGEYTAPSLPTGTYSLKAELSGFKTVTRPDIPLGVDQRMKIDVKLEVGAVEESITVTGTSPLVQTSSSELGTTVETSPRTDSGTVVLCMPLSRSSWLARALTSSIPIDGRIVSDVAPRTARNRSPSRANRDV